MAASVSNRCANLHGCTGAQPDEAYSSFSIVQRVFVMTVDEKTRPLLLGVRGSVPDLKA